MPLLISCKCDSCRQGCGEVKCPYCIDGTNFDSYMQKKSFCLEKKKQFCVQFEKRLWLLSGPATNPHYWLWLLSFHLGCSQGQIVKLAKKVRTINVVPVQQQQNGSGCGAICHSLLAEVLFQEMLLKLNSDLLTPCSQSLQGECMITLDRVLIWLTDVTTLHLSPPW